MPTIEVTQEQAAALARGENVTLSPKPEPVRQKFVLVHRKYGTVFEVRAEDGKACAYRRISNGVEQRFTLDQDWQTLAVSVLQAGIDRAAHSNYVSVEVPYA